MLNLTNRSGQPVPGAGEPVEFSEAWRVSLVADETVDDNDKVVYTAPANTEAQIISMWLEVTTTATAGNRQLEIQIRDSGDDVIYQGRPTVVQAESLARYYAIAPGNEPMYSFYDTDFVTSPFPPLFLAAGWDVRIYDNNNVDSDDDIIVQMVVATRTV